MKVWLLIIVTSTVQVW